MRRLVVLGIVALSFAVPRTASAGSITFVPDVTPGIGAAINSDGFFATPDSMNLSLFGAFAYAYDGHIEAFGAGYSDAGLTVGFGGQFALGDIQSVSVNSTGSPLSINLWLDTSGDNAFFAFDPSSFQMTSLNGDSYGGCGLAALTSVSSCQMFAGNGAGGTYTLAQLQAGAVSGINGSTRVAFWVGGTNTFSADVASITVNTSDVVTPTASVPEPATLTLLGFGLAGLAARLRRR